MMHTDSVLMDRFRNGVLLEAEKRNMTLWTMIKRYRLPLSLQSVFNGKNCLVSTLEETAKGLGVDVCDLLAVTPHHQESGPVPKRRGSDSAAAGKACALR